MPLPPSPIGFDATVIINFCAVGRLDLLVSVVPPPRHVLVDVLGELEQPVCRSAIVAEVQRGHFELAQIGGTMELERWAQYTMRLDAGESATLAAAASRGWSIASYGRPSGTTSCRT